MDFNKSNEKTTILKYFTPNVATNSVPKNHVVSLNSEKNQTNLNVRKTTCQTKHRKIPSSAMKPEKKIPIPFVKINREDSSNDEGNDSDEPVKNLIAQNSANFNPDVFVKFLPPERVALLMKSASKPGENKTITVVDISSDDSDDEPIAKKFSPSIFRMKIDEKKKKRTNFSENKPKKSKNAVENTNKKTKSLTTKEKLSLLKKHSATGSKQKTGNIFSNCKPKSVVRPRTDSSSSVEDAMPLSEVSKILATRTSNDSPKELKYSQSFRTSINFLSPSKTNREQRFKTTVAKLEKLKKIATEKPNRSEKRAFATYAQQIVSSSLLTEAELEWIPNEILKKDMLFRFEREKLKKMNEDERKAYYRKKHLDEAERRKQTVQRENERFEDCDIGEKIPLPVPEPVQMLEKDFGSVLMVAEFAKSFATFFPSENKFGFDLGSLLNALTHNSDGYNVLGKTLMAILEILFQEKCPSELSTSIDEIEVNIYSAAELARLYLSKWSAKNDKIDDSDEFGSNSSFGAKLSDDLSAQLEVEDLFNLDSYKKLEFLTALIHDLLQTQKFEDFLKEKEDYLAAAWKEKFEALAEFKKSKAIETPKETSISSDAPINNNNLSLKHFYGNCVVESNENTSLNADLEAEEDDMIYKVKHRRLLAQKDKEKDKLEKEKLRKEYEMSKKVSRVETANKNLERLQLLTKLYFRYAPLGTDRNHSRYWYFPGVSPYLFLEKGWSPACDLTTPSVSGSPKKSLLSTTFPPVEENSWYFYDSVERVDSLISTLMPKGVRESRLKECLTQKRAEIQSVFEKRSDSMQISLKQPVRQDVADDNVAEFQYKEFLRKEILSTECKIREGGLGGSDDFDDFRYRLESATSLKDFALLLVETQQNVRPSLLKGMMAVKKSLLQVDTEDEEFLTEEEKQYQAEKKRSKCIESWRTAVVECRTWSRIFVLFYIFKNCVMWEKSIENARCNKCRKNKDDDKVILCEICNAGYHIYCLRPPLKKIPVGDWFCERCQPPSSRTRHRTREEIESESSDQESLQHDDVCVRCSNGPEDRTDQLVVCATCPSSFHKACHEPPLRHTPRLGWRCCQCTKGIVIKRNLRKRKFTK